MAEEKKQKNDGKSRPPRQEWNPPWILSLLLKVWMVVFGAAKIALGAAATVVIICGICLMVFAETLGDYLEDDIVPIADFNMETVEMEEPSKLYYVDSNGNIQEWRTLYAEINREYVDFEDIPEDLIHAAVAIEDKRFYEHQGVDWVTTIRACVGMFFGGDDLAGGSTITQQMIKNNTGENSVTVQRKVKEIITAVQAEKKYSKETILENYLNVIFLGQQSYGVKSAAAAYFGKELESLTLAECASLIGITNNPSWYDPYQFPENNKGRQETILGQMLEQGWITQEEYDEAMAQELVLKSGIDLEDRMAYCENEACGYKGLVKTLNHTDGVYLCPQCGQEVPVSESGADDMYSWFEDTVLEDVAKAMAEQDGVEWGSEETRKTYMARLQKGGYHIYTTYDPYVQDVVDSVYTDLDEIPGTRGGQQLQSAIVVIDNRSGDIVAMAGGVGEKEYFDEFNRATDAERQSGSSVKPLTVYGPAFEAGMTPATPIWDIPYTYSLGAYPLNFDRVYSYRSTILNGVVQSINAVAAWIVGTNGLEYSYEFATEKLGFDRYMREYESPYYDELLTDVSIGSLALGDQILGVTVRQMSTAFATFANDGDFREARTFTKVYDRDGNLVLDNTQETHNVFSSKTVNYMNYCLNNAVANYTTEADMPGITEYGKSGTTGDNYDRWYCGFTKYYTAAVWTGFDQPEEIRPTSYDNPAATLWRKVMEPINQDKERAYLHDVSGMSSYTICKDSGKYATSACSQDIRSALSGYSATQSAMAYSGDMSLGSCDKHVLVDYCMTGKGVASEYCKKFAEVDPSIRIEEHSLVKMTQSTLDEIRQAGSVGLSSAYLRNEYIYLINSDGSDASFKGINGGINQGIDAPYLVCPVHTQEAWEQYEKEQAATKPSETTPPTEATPPAVTEPPAA